MLPTKYAKYNLLPTTYNYIYKYFLLPTQVPKYYTLAAAVRCLCWLLAAGCYAVCHLVSTLAARHALDGCGVEWSGLDSSSQ